MINVNLFTSIASHYRKSFWVKLLNSSNFSIEFYYGDGKALDIKSINFDKNPFLTNKNKLHRLKNIWLKEILVWQFGVIKKCLSNNFDKAIFLGEAYCLSTWLAAIICRLRNIEVIFWGHGLYGNEGSLKLFFRNTFYQIADKHLLYGRRGKKLMIKEGFDEDSLHVIFNSLDYDQQLKLRERYKNIKKSDIFASLRYPDLPILVFIGRLTSAKNIGLLLQAVNDMNKGTININLVIIGDGGERQNLEKLGSKGLKESWINFIGACYNEDKIAQYLSAADLCVSPGNVGLTAIHSLSYGTPVCTHDDFSYQMPEAEAIRDGYNGFFFIRGSVKDLRLKIEEWFEKDIEPDSMRQRCFEIIDQYYNPDYQLSVFNRLIEGNNPVI